MVYVTSKLAFYLPPQYEALSARILLAASLMVVRSPGICRMQESATCSRENKHWYGPFSVTIFTWVVLISSCNGVSITSNILSGKLVSTKLTIFSSFTNKLSVGLLPVNISRSTIPKL